MKKLLYLLVLCPILAFAQQVVNPPSSNPGTVTSVSGTANQISVATGTSTPVISIATSPTLPGTTTGTFSGALTGNASTATALAANPANCSAGNFPLGIDASGVSENCTALPTTIVGTANQITASAATGTVTLSIPSSPTIPGTTSGTFSGTTYSTATNCADSAGAAACGSAAAGSFVVDAAATTVVVSTTAVTANSQIFVMFDASLGTRLGITCNATEPSLYGISARTAGTSFTLSATASVTNPSCWSFHIIN